jgi:hypothetical protein
LGVVVIISATDDGGSGEAGTAEDSGAKHLPA